MENSTPDEMEVDVVIPFAGRDLLYAHMQQYLVDPADRHAFVIMGWRGIGKSAVLNNFHHKLDEGFIGVVIQLDDSTTTFAGLLSQIVTLSNSTLYRLGYYQSREPLAYDEREDEIPLAEWFETIWLPDVLRLIRPQRRLALLIDNAHHLINAYDNATLTTDDLRFLRHILESQPQTGVILALDTAYESNLDKLVPLVNPASFHRITYLSMDESTHLVKAILPALDADAIKLMYETSGGHPILLQLLTEHAKELEYPATQSDIKAIIPKVYARSQNDFRDIWLELNQNQRLTLTAISGLLYANPLRTIDTAAIETWLAETDYPLDITTIRAAIRGLEYREIINVEGTTITLKTDLMKKWLIENARLSSIGTDATTGTATSPRTVMIAILVIVLVILAILMITNILPPLAGGASEAPIPTVTLSN